MRNTLWKNKVCFYLNGEHIGKKDREHFYVNEEHIGEKKKGEQNGKIQIILG
jgi:hypothetical protein